MATGIFGYDHSGWFSKTDNGWAVGSRSLVQSDKLLSCIGDILKFPNVSPKAGTGFTLLSFQLDYFPVLEVLIFPIHVTSQLKPDFSTLRQISS